MLTVEYHAAKGKRFRAVTFPGPALVATRQRVILDCTHPGWTQASNLVQRVKNTRISFAQWIRPRGAWAFLRLQGTSCQ